MGRPVLRPEADEARAISQLDQGFKRKKRKSFISVNLLTFFSNNAINPW